MDLEDLCDATIETMVKTIGFNIGNNIYSPQERDKIMNYWEGVMLIPERVLIVARVDGTICGGIQLVLPNPGNHTSNFAGSIDNHFVVPWARGYGASKLLLEKAEEVARTKGLSTIKISVKANRERAITMYEKAGYIKWGTLKKYELDEGVAVPGYFYYKDI